MMVQERKEIYYINIKLLLGFFFPYEDDWALLKMFPSPGLPLPPSFHLPSSPFPFSVPYSVSSASSPLASSLSAVISLLVTCFPISLCS